MILNLNRLTSAALTQWPKLPLIRESRGMSPRTSGALKVKLA
jgi:hypothetical protein